jgi:hypothetical protein
MTTLRLELPLETAMKFNQLEQQHGEKLRQVIGLTLNKLLEKIERTPNVELDMLGETLAFDDEDELEDAAIADYLMQKNAELYRRLA